MKIDIITALEDKAIMGGFMKGESWDNWKIYLRALQGLPMTDEQFEIFKQATKRTIRPTKPFSEAYCVVSRRAGKSLVSSVIAVYLALFGGFEEHTKLGQPVYIFLIATDRAQAKICLHYIKGILDDFPGANAQALREEIRLASNIIISVKTASFRTGRGFQTAGIIMDELSFWRSDTSANPAAEVVTALLPGMLPGGLLLGISSPHGRKGYLWDIYHDYFGKDDEDVLVWQSTTRFMNPTFSQRTVDKAMKRDPVAAQSEYLGLFRSDLEGYLSRENIEHATGEYEMLLPQPGIVYKAFTDPSGGRNDSMTMAIGHNDSGVVVIDRIEARKPPFSPEQVVEEFCAVLKDYGCHEIVGDRFGGEWVESQFRKRGIVYRPSTLSKSEIYVEAIPLFTMGRILLPKSVELEEEVVGLERKILPTGRQEITHAVGFHDDIVNSTLGAAVNVYKELAQAPTPAELEARLPSMKKHPKQIVAAEIAAFNKELMAGGFVPVSRTRFRRGLF
ncbi:MAG: hypothetical protein MIO92_14215 [Methanosarcinaceae archaeon]|nr:hypothetical protein [Methanosarcinaceae archaeon]